MSISRQPEDAVLAWVATNDQPKEMGPSVAAARCLKYKPLTISAAGSWRYDMPRVAYHRDGADWFNVCSQH